MWKEVVDGQGAGVGGEARRSGQVSAARSRVGALKTPPRERESATK